MNDFFDNLSKTSLPVAFSPAERRQLLEDIGFLCLAVNQSFVDKTMGIASKQTSITLFAAQSPFVQLQRLHALLQELLPLLLAAAQQPDSVLVPSARHLPLDRLHGNAATLNAIARSPQAQIALVKQHTPMPLVSETHPALSFSTPVNRLVAAILRELIHHAKAFAILATFCADATAESQARRIGESVGSLLSQEIWREQKPLAASRIPVLLPACRAKAFLPYRIILEKWERYTEDAAAFDWIGLAELTIGERALWQIYEIWCFLQLADALQQSGWSLKGETQVRITSDGMHLVPATGQPSCLSFLPPNESRRVKNPPIRLYYQTLFVSANRHKNSAATEQDHDRYVSRSHAMQPDFVLNGRGRLLVFDAKLRSYSTFGAEQDDIDKMHAYRDGIVRRAGQSLRAAVSAAWCLFPGLPEYGTTLAGVRAYPAPTEIEPFGTGDIGALRLRPSDPDSQIRLRQLLSMLL